MYHKFYEKCGTMGFSFAFNFCSHFFFHKAEIHKIKALHFILEFLKQNVLFFKKGKHIKISLINILNYSLF